MLNFADNFFFLPLAGLGIKCVIARSFAFIYGRSQPNIGLLGIVMDNDEFHSLATDGIEITVDLHERVVQVAGETFPFKLDDLELALIINGGIASAFARFGNGLFEKLTWASEVEKKKKKEKEEKEEKEEKFDGKIPALSPEPEPAKELQW